MASCRIGHVYIVDTVLTKPPKSKFALCVCIANGYFLWINTKAAPHGKDQLILAVGCHPLVTHESYLDLSRVVVHSTAELEDAKEFACISRDFKNRIIEAIDQGLIILPSRHAMIISANLSELYADT